MATLTARDLDDAVRERKTSVAVKIDVEGLEEEVLLELFRTAFSADIVEIFLEIDEEWVNHVAIYKLLNLAGFAPVGSTGGGQHYDFLFQRGAAVSSP